MDNVKRILVPIDSSEIAERAMQQAIKINRFNEAEVHILYVADINKLAINAYLSGNVLIEIEKAGQRILNAAKELFPEGMKIVCAYRTGDPAEAVATPITAKKGGLTYGRNAYIVYHFYYGRCSLPLYLQMVG